MPDANQVESVAITQSPDEQVMSRIENMVDESRANQVEKEASDDSSDGKPANHVEKEASDDTSDSKPAKCCDGTHKAGECEQSCCAGVQAQPKSLLNIDERLRRIDMSPRHLAEKMKLLELAGSLRRNEWRFWSTQPVTTCPPSEKETSEAIEGRKQKSEVRNDPIALPEGFSWSTLDISDEEQLQEVYTLLNANYVQDEDNLFRFDYSKEFLRWALCPPNWHTDWHVGIRATKSRKLVGFISGVPAIIQARGKAFQASEINFLCVHKQLRSKRMAPVLIKEITRRSHLRGVFQGVYTSGTVLPGVVGKCRYWHRSLNVKKLVDINFTYLNTLVTLQRSIRLHRLPNKPVTKGFREMGDNDVEQAHQLLTKYLERFCLSPQFSLEEFKHSFSNRKDIVSSFVVADESGTVTDFASFYHLSSSILQHPVHKCLRAAYSFYNVATKTKIVQLMRDVLIVAKEMGFDVFNALDSMDNRQFLEDLKFGIGDGDLHYYLYNWKTSAMEPNEIGLTLL